MKKLMKLGFAFALALFLSLGGLKAQTVYVTESGKKYHAKNCDIVKTGKKGMELAEAKKKGLEPCKSCKADAIQNEKKAAPAAKGKGK